MLVKILPEAKSTSKYINYCNIQYIDVDRDNSIFFRPGEYWSLDTDNSNVNHCCHSPINTKNIKIPTKYIPLFKNMYQIPTIFTKKLKKYLIGEFLYQITHK